eukprot:4949440-Karenia_brevis.AAC.1
MESNTDVQCPYRSPLTKHTHDTECTAMNCVSNDTVLLKSLCKKVQRTQKISQDTLAATFPKHSHWELMS